MFPQLREKTIPALNGVRAIAVALVMVFHFGFSKVPGGHGVLIFFVLSGFLITWLMLMEQEMTGDVSLANFYVRRALRILPAAYAFVVLMLLVLFATHRHIVWTQVACVFAYVANYFTAFHAEQGGNAVFNHLWSLAIEEQFYLFWPFVFVRLSRKPDRMPKVVGTAIVAIWLYRAILGASGVSSDYIYHAFDTRADHLLIGCFTAIMVKRGSLDRLWKSVTRAAWMPLATWSLFFCSALYGNEHHAYRHLVGYAVEPVLAAVGIVQLVGISKTATWRWLDAGPIAWMGRISYSLYLYQQVGVSPFVLPRASLPVRFVVCISVTFALAAASHYLIERPFLQLKQHIRRREAAPVLAV